MFVLSRRSDLISVLPECINFVIEGVSKGGVLVHCMSGVSRSAAVSIAYKMKIEGKSYDDAYTELKTARPDVDPNAGFIAQVRLYVDSLFLSPSRGRFERQLYEISFHSCTSSKT